MRMAGKRWKGISYLFWLSPFLIAAGLTVGIVTAAWDVVPLALMGVGVAIAILWLAYYSRAVPELMGRRSTQAGTNAVVATLAILVILGLVNFLSVRYTARLDLTENQIFSLAPQTTELLSQLEAPVEVLIFDQVPNPQDQRLLENYQRNSANFSYEYIDPQAEPGLVREFGVTTPGEVYLQQGEQRSLVQTLRAGDPQVGVPEERLSERQLTSAIAQLLNPIEAKVYIIQGHGERFLEPGQGGISEAIASLADGNYTVEPLNLAEATTVPDDASVVILPGPQRPLLEVEVAALETYLEDQSGLMILADPETETGLAELLSGWGVQEGDRLIVDPAGQAAGLGAAVPIITQYGDHPITREFGNGISFFPVAQPLILTEEEGITTSPLLITSDRTEGQRVTESGQLEFDPEVDPQGSMILGVALSQPVEGETAEETTPEEEELELPPDEEESEPEARLVVIGNSSFVTDGLFNQQLNGDIFLNSVNWLSQTGDQTFAIRPRELTNRRILLNGQSQVLLALLALLFLPLLGFGLATGIWWMRR